LRDGLDDIALSLEKTSAIDLYEKKTEEKKPWIIKND
jgi:3-isopropylmalate dehydratase small subunit